MNVATADHRYRCSHRCWSRPPGAAAAFTLIELLVVVAIIALLLSILLPALGQAKAQGKMVVCGSNLRQMGIALHSYLQENRDFFPGEHSVDYTPVNVWAPRLRRYAAMQEKLFWCPAADMATHWTVKLEWPFVPPHMRGYGYQPGERPVFSGDNGDLFPYGYNSWGVAETFDAEKKMILGLGANVGDGGCPWVWAVRLSDVKRPADMITLADSKADGVWDSAIDPETWQDHEWPSARHRGGAQVMFCDGHVVHGKQKKLVEPTEWARRRWNNDFLPHEDLWQDAAPGTGGRLVIVVRKDVVYLSVAIVVLIGAGVIYMKLGRGNEKGGQVDFPDGHPYVCLDCGHVTVPDAQAVDGVQGSGARESSRGCTERPVR